MRVLIAPGTFKGTLSAAEAAAAMAEGVQAADCAAEPILMPVGDGGEGTSAALMRAIPGSREAIVSVTGPLGETVSASFSLLGPNGAEAALDMASASGLLLISESARNPLQATTYGVGELIAAALKTPGVTRLIIGLGGSATNDGGAGCLQGLGCEFLDSAGRPLPAPLPPERLNEVSSIRVSSLLAAAQTVEIIIACDVDNPLAGPRGASFVFGPQKGATPEIAARLDGLLAHFGSVLDGWAGGAEPISLRPGSGAAGGLGAGLIAAFPMARMQPGIDVVMEASGFDRALVTADLVLTGEGRLDGQTLGGKAVHGVLRRAKTAGVPVAVIAGSAEQEAVDALAEHGLGHIITLTELAGSSAAAMSHSAHWAAAAARIALERFALSHNN